VGFTYWLDASQKVNSFGGSRIFEAVQGI
jgi:hypothetical protein